MAEKQVESVRKLTGILHIAEIILSQLDVESLRNASKVSPYWQSLIRDGRLWKRQLEKKVASDPAWAKFAKQRRSSLPRQLDDGSQDEILYEQVEADVNELDDRWRNGQYTMKFYPTASRSFINGDEIATGSEDAVKIWNLDTGLCVRTCNGLESFYIRHVRFDHRMVICANSRGELRIWDRSDPDGSGPCNVIPMPDKGFDELTFSSNLIIIGPSYSRFIDILEIHSPRDVRYATSMRRFDHRFEEFAGRIINMPDLTLIDRRAHELIERHRIALYVRKDGLLVHDHYREFVDRKWIKTKIDIWDVESGTCLRTLLTDGTGRYLVAFDSKRIAIAVCFSNDLVRFRILDLKQVLDRSIPEDALVCTEFELEIGTHLRYMEINEFQLKVKCAIEPDGVFVYDFRNLCSAPERAPDGSTIE